MRLVADRVDIGITTRLAPVDLAVDPGTARCPLVPVRRGRARVAVSDHRPTSPVAVVVAQVEQGGLPQRPVAVRADWACLRRFPVRRSSMRAVVVAVCIPPAQLVRVEVVWAELESSRRGPRPETASMAVVVAVAVRERRTRVRARVVTVDPVSSSCVTQLRVFSALRSA